ncbi:MAG: 16S rRNA (guanine(966)-N(2))-methyltransferase RsmD [Candidatus Omnitrophota bacterium]
MRITGGDFKGQFLKTARTKNVRPTREMVRKAVFDVLEGFVPGKQVLDLFSGSGAFGLEALSRGAQHVSFVENEYAAVKIIKSNIMTLRVNSRCKIIVKDVFLSLDMLKKKEEKFDIIFADPPYHKNLAKKCLLQIDNCDILNTPAMVVMEHYKKDELPNALGTLTLWQFKQYGDSAVSFYTPV